MEVRIYSPELDFLGLLENQTSLIWTRRYFEPGEFELHAPITPYNVELIRRGRLVSFRTSNEAGVIEDLKLDESATARTIIASGRFLESYMDRRVIHPTFTFSGKTEVAMRNLLTSVATLPLVQLGTLQDFPETINFQATYKNLLSVESKLARSAGFGFRFRPDFTDKTITFEVYKGLDHSAAQSDRNRVIFSEEYNNLNAAIYEINDQLYKNVAYVGGQGEGSARTIVIAGDDTLTGLERREMFVDADDISPEGISSTAYTALLQQRGEEKLAEAMLSEMFECDTDANRGFVYRRDYDLGDIVTIRKDSWNVGDNLRITELMEVYEYGSLTITPTFGSPLPSTINWEED